MAKRKDKYLSYRGDIKALIGLGGRLFFVTTHPEEQPTALYELDSEELKLKAHTLPCGGRALTADEKAVTVIGTDDMLYQLPLKGKKKPAALTKSALATPVALTPVSGGRLAVVAGTELLILDGAKGKELGRFPLEEEGSAVAASPDGRWLAVGTVMGRLLVFEAEKQDDFKPGDAQKLHEGAISSLLFDREELRVLSAGADGKLLLTHVRGRLDPEDRGGKNNHERPITALITAFGNDFYTGSSDRSFKTWPGGLGRKRPLTMKDGVSKIVAMALAEYKKRPHLVLACEDATLRFFDLEENGRPKERELLVHGAVARINHELDQKDPARREAALRTLAEYNDAASIERLALRAIDDEDHTLRVLSTKLLGETGNARARLALEQLLSSSDEAVRRAALAGLRKLEGENALRPLRLALDAAKEDIGLDAVKALETLSKRDDQALSLLIKALERDPTAVRTAALMALEAVYGKKRQADALLTGLRSKKSDIRRLALVRLFQCKVLKETAVQAALRRHGEDDDADVRQTAFFVSVLSRSKLTTALRERDADLHRKLSELENFGKKKAKETKPPKSVTVASDKLKADDQKPLLQAMASRALDTCLRGATALALLQDSRAFGTLLQLSREKQEGTRVEVCKALRNLDDPRGIARLRLMIRDAHASVRDAAFSALSGLEAKRPLEAARAGLQAEHEDVRRRALQLLVGQIKKKKKKPKSKEELSWNLLERSLNDSFAEVRSEAFKAALNLQFAGGGEKTLRFALQSLHRDIRSEVFVEVMAQINEDWAWPLVLDLLSDPDAGLRREAFDFAMKRSKGRSPAERFIELLSSALDCPYSDLRAEATKALSGCKEEGAEALLFRALDDEDESVRQLGLAALLDTGSPALSQVMKSKYPDVRARAAHARALEGDPESLVPLLQLVTEEQPEIAELKKKWLERVLLALKGLSELGSPGALETLKKPLFNEKDGSLRRGAAQALAYCSRPGNTEILFEALRHSDETVRMEAAVGLAACGDTTGASVIFGGRGGSPGAAPEVALRAALALGAPAENSLISFLDHDRKAISSRAFLALMMLELCDPSESPERCLAGLSAQSPEIRLKSARALQSYSKAEQFEGFIVTLINEREDDKDWTIPSATVRALGEVLAHGDSMLRFRAAPLLTHLDKKKQDDFERAWERFSRRFGSEIAALEAGRAKRAAATKRPAAIEIARLVFGTYVGLGRLQGGEAARIRQTALRRLFETCKEEKSLSGAVRPVLVLALGDSNQAVRKQAFEYLAEITSDVAELCAEALSSGQRDVAALGFAKLIESGDAETSKSLLERVLTTHSDGLEHEAARILSEDRGQVAVYQLSFEAQSEELRTEAVRGLAKSYEEAAAAKALRGALEARYRDVRVLAALELAAKKDEAAFATLSELLFSDEKSEQMKAITSLSELGDDRAPDLLLDRIVKDPAGTALTDDLFKAVGNARKTGVVERLLGFMKKSDHRRYASSALLKISGYDQEIGEDEKDPDWQKKQHPRRDEVLVQLMETNHRLSEERVLKELMAAARWCPSSAIEPVLSSLAFFPREGVRHLAVEALGWRLRKRDGKADTLIKALEHDDVVTRFLAAEGLALARRKEGLGVLQVSVELLPEVYQRQRAVKALGRLGDEQALDLLLRLINEDGHALQEEAAEALGHMSESDQAETVFETLSRLAQGSYGVAMSALTGLRWFGSLDAWKIIRARAEDDYWSVRQHIAKLLAHDKDPRSREILRTMIEKDYDSDVAEAAVESLRKICGPNSLEPDYALICCEHSYLVSGALERLKERGDAAELLEVLSKVSEEQLEAVTEVLLSRLPLPLEEAARALSSSNQNRTLRVAAQILGRAGAEAAAHGEALVAASARMQERWNAERARIADGDRELVEKMEASTETYRSIIWALGRLGVGGAELIAASGGHYFEPIRRAALTSLSRDPEIGGAEGLEALQTALFDPDAPIRALAASGLRRLDPERAVGLVSTVLDDRTSLDRLLEGQEVTEKTRDALRQAAATVHHQGVALPHLIAQGDIEGLAGALGDGKLPEATRLGALEGLARLAQKAEPADAAEEPLLAFAKNDGEDEELRKAAWRALRRARRQRKKNRVESA